MKEFFFAAGLGKSCYKMWKVNKPGVFYLLFCVQSREIPKKKLVLELLANKVGSLSLMLEHTVIIVR